MQTNESKSKRIAELEAELAELTKPVLLRVFGKDVNIVGSKRHAPKQKNIFARNKDGSAATATTNVVPLIEYTED